MEAKYRDFARRLSYFVRQNEPVKVSNKHGFLGTWVPSNLDNGLSKPNTLSDKTDVNSSDICKSCEEEPCKCMRCAFCKSKAEYLTYEEGEEKGLCVPCIAMRVPKKFLKSTLSKLTKL